MAQSYNGGVISVTDGLSIGATSAPPLASPSPLRRTRGGRLFKNALENEEIVLSQLSVDTKFPSPSKPSLEGPTVEDARDETQHPKAPITVDSRDEASHRAKMRAPIPFPKMKSLSMPTWIDKNNPETPTMRCVRTIDENSVLLDEDFLALQQYIELDFLDDSSCTSEMRDAIMDMVLSDICERGIAPTVSSLSASQLMVSDDDSIDSLEADLASEIPGEGITAPPCISQGSDYNVPSPKSAKLSAAAAETQKSTRNTAQSQEQCNLESSQTKEKPSDQSSVSQKVDECSPNPALETSNHSVGLAAQTKRSVNEIEKETSVQNGTENKATTMLKSNSTISTVPSAETPKVYDGDKVISNLSSLTASTEGGSAAGSVESEESDNSSTTGVEKVHRTASSFDSEAELSTQWDAMLETISQKLFVPSPGLMQAHNQEHDESKSNKCDQGHIESFCSTFASQVRHFFDTAKGHAADSYASAQVMAKSTCVKPEDLKQDDDKTVTMVKKMLGASNTVELPTDATDKLQIVVQDGPDEVKKTVHKSPDSSRMGIIYDRCSSCVQIGGNDSRSCCSEQAELQNLVCGNGLLNYNAKGDIINLSGPSLSSISMNSLSATPGGFGQTQPSKQAQIPKPIVSRTTVRNEESSGRPPLAPPSGTGRWRRVLNIRRKIPTLGKTSQGRCFSSGIKTM